MASATYRWWSNSTSFVLAPTDGVVTLSVPLRGEQWTDVGGMTGVRSPMDLPPRSHILQTSG
jgi:hypothetical protein